MSRIKHNIDGNLQLAPAAHAAVLAIAMNSSWKDREKEKRKSSTGKENDKSKETYIKLGVIACS